MQQKSLLRFDFGVMHGAVPFCARKLRAANGHPAALQ
jgi:hypothetical protein